MFSFVCLYVRESAEFSEIFQLNWDAYSVRSWYCHGSRELGFFTSHSPKSFSIPNWRVFGCPSLNSTQARPYATQLRNEPSISTEERTRITNSDVKFYLFILLNYSHNKVIIPGIKKYMDMECHRSKHIIPIRKTWERGWHKFNNIWDAMGMRIRAAHNI